MVCSADFQKCGLVSIWSSELAIVAIILVFMYPFWICYFIVPYIFIHNTVIVLTYAWCEIIILGHSCSLDRNSCFAEITNSDS